MAFLVSSLMVLVMISSPIYSISCDFDLAKSLNLGKQEIFKVEQMGTISTLSCLKNRANFQLPKEQLDGSLFQKAQAMSILQEMLRQTIHLFLSEHSSAAWNMTLLDQLLNGLYRHLQALDTCLLEEVGEEDSALGIEGPILAVKKYFQGIHLYLQEKKYTDCAWEVVRVEIRRCFFLTNKLIRKFSL